MTKFHRISIKKLIQERVGSIDEQISRDEILKNLNNQHLKFYHGRITEQTAEKLILDNKKNNLYSSETTGLFLIYDASNDNDFILVVLNDSSFYHIKIQHIEDAYFKLPDGQIVHGLEKVVEMLSLELKIYMPCKLKSFVQGILPPNSSIKFGYTNLLHKVVYENSLNLLDEVLKNENSPQINVKDLDGSTALHLAIESGNIETTKKLLNAGSDLKIRNKNGLNALHISCALNHVEMLKLLIIDFKSNINDCNPENLWTPLHTAAFHESLETILALVNEFGADLNTKNINNETPEELAKNNKKFESAKMLRKLASGNFSYSCKEDWFHENTFFQEACALLESIGKIDGLFLIIKNEFNLLNYSLIFYLNGQINNFEITSSINGYQIGLGPIFNLLEQLVDFYCQNKSDLPCVLSKCLNFNGEIIDDVLKKKFKKEKNLPLKTQNFKKFNNYTTVNHDILVNNLNKNLSSYDNRSIVREYVELNLESSRDYWRNDIFRNQSQLDINSLINSGLNYSQKPISNPIKNAYSDQLHLITSNMIKINHKIGQGEFGFVFEGTLNLFGNETKAAIKQLKLEGNFQDSYREAKIIASLNHPSIIKVYGICHELNSIALELVILGSLNKYLKNNTGFNNNSLKLWSYQIADAMMYLEANKLVHRDLACRNILVCSIDQVKITDFGMARYLDRNDIYIQNSRTKIPFKWYPLEAIENDQFTSKSDVWSYGITVWEIYSLGDTPYSNLSYSQVITSLKNGLRLNRATHCTQFLHNMLLMCWQNDPNLRPSFNDIVSFFKTNYKFI